jgi:hypothetical protein
MYSSGFQTVGRTPQGHDYLVMGARDFLQKLYNKIELTLILKMPRDYLFHFLHLFQKHNP